MKQSTNSKKWGNNLIDSVKPKFSNRSTAVVVIVSVLLFLSLASNVIVAIHGGQFFGQDLWLNLSTALGLISLPSYGAVIAFTVKNQPKIAALFLIPTVLSNLFLYAGYIGLDFGPEYYLPLISLSKFFPEWWAGSLLIGLEIPAVIVVAILLLLPNKTSNQSNQNVVKQDTIGAPMEKVQFCPGCGAPAGEDNFCSKCGRSLTGSVAPGNAATGSNPTTNTMAVVAFILSFFVPIVGLILGYISRKEIDNSQGRFTGRGFATAAIVLNWIWIVFIVIWGIGLGIVAAQYSSY